MAHSPRWSFPEMELIQKCSRRVSQTEWENMNFGCDLLADCDMKWGIQIFDGFAESECRRDINGELVKISFG